MSYAERTTLTSLLDAALAELAAERAKAAKLVEALDRYFQMGDDGYPSREIARKALAEHRGGAERMLRRALLET